MNPDIPDTFQALVVNKTDTSFSVNTQALTLEDLPIGEVVIQVAYSSVNYKDGLASIPDGNIVKSYPFVPGIDLSGYVVSSSDKRFTKGQPVIATGYDIGVSHFGGFSQYVRIPAKWIIPLPEGLTLKEAMILGTAGFTAALSIQSLELNGISPEQGKVLVTGATGGVGGAAIAMLAKNGYHVDASTGNANAAHYLKALGAKEILSREDVLGQSDKPLNKQLWQAAVDSVGGATLAAILSKLAYRGAVAASGLTGGASLPTTVLPFILRGVSLMGIDSVFCDGDTRTKVWNRMATDLKPNNLDTLIDREVTLRELPEALKDILQSRTLGRILVALN
ncbi:putative quinone oxidoreductase YhfP [Cohnella abietis]|uniref:Putative quinone oxidoreductase YhfP n=1 Tax=Cohnella abietis TaxID=2507935 RepID=A0A3T1DCC2_9BACL|nr:putative quinone oxidoreductase YhfP [Cohnella abietis]